MKLVTKFFDELTTTELYEILKARAEIFIMEQEILYQDMDDIDYRSLHIFYEEDGKVLAYLRAFPKEGEEGAVKVGRVLTIEHGTGLGGKLLKEGLKQIKEKMNPTCIHLDSQTHAIGFYEREGFQVCSEEFLEEGIMHVKMVLQL